MCRVQGLKVGSWPCWSRVWGVVVSGVDLVSQGLVGILVFAVLDAGQG